MAFKTQRFAGILSRRVQTARGQFCARFYSSRRDEDSLGGSSLTQTLDFPQFFVWGANTEVGKTLVSTGLVAAALGAKDQELEQKVINRVLYCKPAQTGFPRDSDSRFVLSTALNIISDRCEARSEGIEISYSDSIDWSSRAGKEVRGCEENGSWVAAKGHLSLPDCSKKSPGAATMMKETLTADTVAQRRPASLLCRTMWAWAEPVSPHLTAEREGLGGATNEAVVASLRRALDEFGRGEDRLGEDPRGTGAGGVTFALVEQAGGVASPGPSGTLQCDLFRPLRLPAVLVGDMRLGGISATIAAAEVLKLRGYDIAAVTLADGGLGNHKPLEEYLQGRTPLVLLPPLPPNPDPLLPWFQQAEPAFSRLLTLLNDFHQSRLMRLQQMPKQASSILWWPFTQHGTVKETDVTVIDSRWGEDFSVFREKGLPNNNNNNNNNSQTSTPSLQPQFDACASWWTQGMSAALQPELGRAVGYAASRYGHVMFPENVNEPALRLAELLLEGPGKGWASRVFFSDNGSTGMEVALKMALRHFCASTGKTPPLQVLALSGSYHGDTLGAMSMQSPSPFNSQLQHPWYSARGVFIDPPSVAVVDGQWKLSVPAPMLEGRGSLGSFGGAAWDARDNVFDLGRDESDEVAAVYLRYIRSVLEKEGGGGETETHSIGALVTEPVLHGAGGMVMIDPLFQRVLVNECKRRGIPVIFDEVFTGCWRLGRQSAAELLGVSPDIATYAKLLTGGIVPLAATLATEAVFNAFHSTSKLEALLHGHSYTAHPIGCSAAVAALELYQSPSANPNLCRTSGTGGATGPQLRELWDPDAVREISKLPRVARVVSLGTVFAAELRTDAGAEGYGSSAARKLLQPLREDGIFCRALGSVIYLMCTPFTSTSKCSNLLQTLARHLQ